MTDIPRDHDLSDRKKFTKAMRKEEKRSRAPCGECLKQESCTAPAYCKAYKAWRSRYLDNTR